MTNTKRQRLEDAALRLNWPDEFKRSVMIECHDCGSKLLMSAFDFHEKRCKRNTRSDSAGIH